MENRDFKGIWIPKEIWLDNALSMIEKGILAEISSLDNENHCTASNEYFAKFCQCSVPTVTRAIKKLIELKYIEAINFDGRHRILKMMSLPNQNDEAASSKRLTNNTSNNTSNNSNLISKDIKLQDSSESEFQFGKVKPKKPNLYNQCVSAIDDFTSKHPDVDRKLLIDYLNVCMEGKYLLGINQWCGMLNNTLVQALKNSVSGVTFNGIIQKSIDRAYKTFYPIQYGFQGNSTQKSGVPYDVSRSVKVTQEQRERMEELAEERTRNGKIGYF
jgi:DNA-binding Lrp family transcriptional regulator